jgi:hypothetical protein
MKEELNANISLEDLLAYPKTECCEAEIEGVDNDSAPHCKKCLRKVHVNGKLIEPIAST